MLKMPAKHIAICKVITQQLTYILSCIMRNILM